MLLRSNACVMSPFVGITYSFVFSPHIYNKQKENIMSDQQTIERIQQEVVSGNKDRLYQATLKEVNMNNFNKAKAIYKSSSGLDNISEELKTQFDTIMLGGK